MPAPEPAPAAAQLLRGAGLPQGEARALLCHVLGVPREQLIAHPDTVPDAEQRRRFAAAVAQRRAGTPLAYLLGTQEFHGHVFTVGPAVLVPRPDTEVLVDTALALLAPARGARVLELGTGSGCIALSLALARPDLFIVATDRSLGALRVASANRDRLGARVALLAADWYAGVVGPFDLVISNPPYIAPGDPHLPALAGEPREALVSGAGGLRDIAAVVQGAGTRLRAGGHLLVEHGHDQGRAVREIFQEGGLGAVRTLQDLAGRDRACLGVWAGQAG